MQASTFFSRLDQLELLSRRILSGTLRGQHTTHRRGSGGSLEWADFRDYVAGDDPRLIDWNIYARLDRPLVKLLVHEEELFVDILLDTSKSCDFGEPAKSAYLKDLAMALGYVGLVNQHHVTLWSMAEELKNRTGSLRGRGNAARMFKALMELQSAGASDFVTCCQQLATSARHKGICIMLSDFLFRDRLRDGMRILAGLGHDLLCIQALSPQEMEPPLSGTARLVDLERAEARDMQITPKLVAEYKSNLTAHCARVKEAVEQVGGSYLFARTDEPVDRLVLDRLRRIGRVG